MELTWCSLKIERNQNQQVKLSLPFAKVRVTLRQMCVCLCELRALPAQQGFCVLGKSEHIKPKLTHFVIICVLSSSYLGIQKCKGGENPVSDFNPN